MASVQLGILLDEELKDWFVNKCRTTRSTDASKRLLSAATVIAAYLEYFREQDNIDPFGIVPQLKGDTEMADPQKTIESPPAVDWDSIVNPIKEEIEQLKENFEACKDYRQKLTDLELKLNSIIEEKISEHFARLQQGTLLNLNPNSSSNNNQEDIIKSELEIESTITPEGEVITELEPIVVPKDPEAPPVESVEVEDDPSVGASWRQFDKALDEIEKNPIVEPTVVLPSAIEEATAPKVHSQLEVFIAPPQGIQAEELGETPLQQAIKHWETTPDGLLPSGLKYGERIDRKIILKQYISQGLTASEAEEKYETIADSKKTSKH